MNGYRTCIFEMDDARPGGLCTSWKRKGYTIDGCIHTLAGSAPGTGFYRIWEELGAVQGRVMVDHEEYVRIEGEGGKVFIVYTDINRLEQHMKELAPEDKDVIEEFIKALHSCTRFDMPVEKAPELHSPIEGLKMMFTIFPYLRFMRKWGRISIQDFAKRFKNPFLREAFSVTFDLPDFPMMAMLMILAWLHQKTAGYPVGGSLEFARAIERRYLNLGGEVHYKSRVTKILVENDQAVGVRLADGTEHRSDIVISAADAEALAYVSNASLAVPLASDWVEIYQYLLTRVMKERVTEELRRENLDNYRMGLLKELQQWLWQKRIRYGEERRRAERAEAKALERAKVPPQLKLSL